MSDFLKSLFGASGHVSRADTTPDGPDPDPNDMWAFTDPDAKDDYTRRGQLRELEHDLRFEVMRAEPWSLEDLAYKLEIRRLLREGVLADKGTYWYRSPHPTVYRAQRIGALTVAGTTYRFHTGDDLVFQCRMERDRVKDDPGPVLIARLQSTGQTVLCNDMPDAMKGTSQVRGGMA